MMKRVGALAASLGLLVAADGAQAATQVGTILTNIVSATMWDGPLLGDYYEVSYNSSAYVQVIPPARVELLKSVNMAQASAGTTVIFSICLRNYGANTSAWGVTLTDRLPSYMTFVSATSSWTSGNFNSSNPAPAAPAIAWGAAPGAGMTGLTGAQGGSTAPFYLRWTFDYIGPNQSACVTYSARIQ